MGELYNSMSQRNPLQQKADWIIEKISKGLPFIVLIDPVKHTLADKALEGAGHFVRSQVVGVADNNRFNNNRVRFLLAVNSEANIQPLKTQLIEQINEQTRLCSFGTGYNISFGQQSIDYRGLFGVRWFRDWRFIQCSIGKYRRSWLHPMGQPIIITPNQGKQLMSTIKLCVSNSNWVGYRYAGN